MAELDVRPKKSSPWWLWLLIALIVLALIYFFVGRDDNEIEDDMVDEPEVGFVEPVSPLNYALAPNTIGLELQKTA